MTHWISETRRARKAHRCDTCGRQITPGEHYRHGAGMDGSTAWSWAECAHCRVLAAFVMDLYDLDEYDWTSVAEWDPADLGEFRVKAQWRRQWRRVDGGLYPVPVVHPLIGPWRPRSDWRHMDEVRAVIRAGEPARDREQVAS